MKKIINKLKEKKFIPLDEFMNLALYDKKKGYYTNKNPFGKKGDFITSPLVSNLFGEMIAIWCVAYWEYLGKPNKIFLIELGPGDGTLCNILLRSFKKFTQFYNSLEINLFETSKKLEKVQKSKLREKNEKVKWINNIDEINKGPVIFFGNEFFDSLAIKQFYKKKSLFFEKYVTFVKNKNYLKFTLKRANKHQIKKLSELGLVCEGNTIEYPIYTIKYLNKIAKKINLLNGCILTFDYGYTAKINQNTLQSVRNHKYANPLENIGSTDISSHVNFKLVAEILENNHLNVKKIITQNEFLQKMGINNRANIISKDISFKEKAKLFYQLKKLVDIEHMGGLFKVLLAQKKGEKFNLGF